MRVLVVSANQLAQVGLGALVEQAAGLEVVAAVPPEGAMEAVARLGPEAVLVDAGIGGHGVLTLLEGLARGAAGTPVLVLTDDHALVAEAVTSGAAAVLSTDLTPAVLTGALDAVGAGLLVLARGLAAGLLPAGGGPDEVFSPMERLTPREAQVLQLLAQGLTNTEIGSRLGVSEHTAKFHVGAVLGKLGARSRAEAVALGSRLGWITI